MAKPKSIQPLGSSLAYIRMAIVAPSGFGKTVFGGTAARGLFLTTDPEGTLSAKQMGSTCEEWKIQKWEDLEDAYKWLRDEGSEFYDWLIVDNVTESQNLAKIMNRELALKNNGKRAPYKYALDDYGVAQEAISSLILKFNDLPMHILYTIHIKGREDPDGNDYYSAAIQGKDGEIAEKILGYMNIIGMGEVVVDSDDNEVRRFWFTHYGPFRGKDRFNALGRYRDKLTIPRLERLLTESGALAGAKKPATRKATATRRNKANA